MQPVGSILTSARPSGPGEYDGDMLVVAVGRGLDRAMSDCDADMPVPTDDLFAIANDPRVDVITSRDAVNSGSDLSFWQATSR